MVTRFLVPWFSWSTLDSGPENLRLATVSEAGGRSLGSKSLFYPVSINKVKQSGSMHVAEF